MLRVRVTCSRDSEIDNGDSMRDARCFELFYLKLLSPMLLLSSKVFVNNYYREISNRDETAISKIRQYFSFWKSYVSGSHKLRFSRCKLIIREIQF